MPSTYSDDFRRAVIGYVKQGHSCHEAARIFATSPSFVIRLMQQYRQTGRISGLPRSGAHHAKLTPFLDEIMGWIEGRPDITLREMALRLLEMHELTAWQAPQTAH